MKHLIIPMLLVGGFVALATTDANAIVCAAGPYRAGCVVRPHVHPHAVVVAPRGVVVVAPRHHYHRRVY
jgi:hypothetical protein